MILLFQAQERRPPDNRYRQRRPPRPARKKAERRKTKLEKNKSRLTKQQRRERAKQETAKRVESRKAQEAARAKLGEGQTLKEPTPRPATSPSRPETEEITPEIPILERALTLTPRDSLILCDLGVCHLNDRNFERSILLFEKALQQEPQNNKAKECLNTAKFFSREYQKLKKRKD